MPQNLLFFYTGSVSNILHKCSPGGNTAVKGKHIFLDIVGIPFIGFTVHMDGKAGNHYQIPVNIYKMRFKSPGIFVFCDHSSGDGKRPVKPGGTQHTAVSLHIQTYVMTLRFQLRIFLNLKSGRITVAGHYAHTRKILFRNSKSNKGRTVAHNKITPAPPDMPFFIFM